MPDFEYLREDRNDSALLPSPIRRAIARQTVFSTATVPHFYLHAELDAGPLVAFRAEWNKARSLHATITDLMLTAQARALRDVRFANSIWLNDRIVTLEHVAVGLVVSVDGGILTPVLRDLDQMDLAEVVAARAALVAAVRNQGLPSNAFAGAASSLSNLGASRVDYFDTVVSPPQSSMLSAGRIAIRPWVSGDQVVPRPTLKLGLAVDHRVLDGIPAAQFLESIVGYLETPQRLENR
jgi:pyruvate dehydrogenase E2 component (dihydrolipoamide acetyltransferase)